MELLQSDLAVLAVLMTAVVATSLAIVADYAPERRQRRAVTRTER